MSVASQAFASHCDFDPSLFQAPFGAGQARQEPLAAVLFLEALRFRGIAQHVVFPEPGSDTRVLQVLTDVRSLHAGLFVVGAALVVCVNVAMNGRVSRS